MTPSSSARLGAWIKEVFGQSVTLLKKHRRLLQYAISGAILLFLGLYVYRNARELAGYELGIDLPSLALASVLILFVNFLTPLTWGLVLWKCLKTRLRWQESLKIWNVSQVSKYLPGSVWNYVSRVYLCTERGISTSKAILSMVLEIVLILMAQVLVVMLSLPFWLDDQEQALWVLIILPLGLILLNPRIFGGLVKFVARRSGLEEPPLVLLSPGIAGALLAIYTFGAIVVGVAFFFFANSLYPLPLNQMPAMTGIVTVSVVIGFFAPFAPNGLGIREGLLAVLLSQYVPAPVAAVISLASRLWLTAAEVAGLLIALAVQPRRGNNPKGL